MKEVKLKAPKSPTKPYLSPIPTEPSKTTNSFTSIKLNANVAITWKEFLEKLDIGNSNIDDIVIDFHCENDYYNGEKSVYINISKDRIDDPNYQINYYNYLMRLEKWKIDEKYHKENIKKYRKDLKQYQLDKDKYDLELARREVQRLSKKLV
jgi:hypothetical protein